MTDETRVEALPFGDHYFAVIHRPGKPNDILDGDDGKPKRFATAYAAIQAGKAMLVPAAREMQKAAKTFGRDRRRELDDERDRVFSRFGGAE